MTIDLDAQSLRWWTDQHIHARRCWWNWEIGRWICPDTSDAKPAPTAGDARSAPGR